MRFEAALAAALIGVRRTSLARKAAVVSDLRGAHIHRERVSREIACKSFAPEKKIAFGEVYVPNDLDTHGDAMTADEIEKMAHLFMLNGLNRQIDVDHNNLVGKACAVESFIVRPGDPDFPTPGAWVVAGKFFDGALWEEVKSGRKASWSFEADVVKIPVRVEVPNLGADFTGRTNKSAKGGPSEPHDHTFTVFLDENGNVASGRTDSESGHFHTIKGNLRTEPAQDGHVHTFSVPLTIAAAA